MTSTTSGAKIDPRHRDASGRTAETDYRSAVLASVTTHGISKTARAAGVSRQAVQQLVRRQTSDEQTIRARLAELDARWDKLVAWRASAYTLKTAQATTAWRNGQAKKRAKRGLGPLPTVREEALALAETELLQLLEQNIGQEGLDLEVLRREVQEAQTLRDRLTTLTDGIPF